MGLTANDCSRVIAQALPPLDVMSIQNRLPPLNWLRSFEVAVRSLSLTAVAGELGLTQSAVSRQIKNLNVTLAGISFSDCL